MKKLIVLVITFLCVLSVYSRPIAHSSWGMEGRSDEERPNDSAMLENGQVYYHENSKHRLPLKKGDVINFKELDADLKVISWDKDYTELEIYKTSSCQNSLECKEVLFDTDTSSICSCCSRENNPTLISIRLKLPFGVRLGDTSGACGRVCIKDYQADHFRGLVCR